jgi:hypothetical protein
VADDTNPDEAAPSQPPRLWQPTWAWVLLLGIPGAAIASVIASRRGTTVKRGTWPAAWCLALVGIILAIALPRVIPRSATGNSASPISSYPPSSVPTPPPPATPTVLDRTDTATWTDKQGYSFQATVALGHLAPFQPGMTLSLSGSATPLVAGRACQLVAGVDALIPGEVTVSNQTTNFPADVKYTLVYRVLRPPELGSGSAAVWQALGSRSDDPKLLTEMGYSTGPSCVDNADAINAGPNITCTQVAAGSSCSTCFFIVVKHFYSPLHPNGDNQQTATLGLGLDATDYGTSLNDTLTGPDMTCDAQNACEIALKKVAP